MRSLIMRAESCLKRVASLRRLTSPLAAACASRLISVWRIQL
ncbi:hypothetical protein PXO_00034 [Xanthomonas oryzae pv. oryzae PXO99A]|uniref:Uncharacterized protein n=1 Tax=Xanthomonas oryzae pv. oryzae (strain PXO99A) TaxID=360094 RepID=A0A0K0GJK2_XANOP|nr:hypothetical protein PXO_00034 [Xanthomonas oryzae pv. oryzae PXO99A]